MPRCADFSCGRWRPERLAPKWASGLRYNGRWYCSRACVESAARAGLDQAAIPAAPASALPPLRLGVLLRHLGAINEQTLALALESQKKSGRRLGVELQRLGLVGPEPILRALAAQGSVSYLASFELERVTRGPAWLPAATVRALGLVPFEVDELQKTVRVVCSAPVPRAAIRAMVKLTGWTPEPYLVDDDVWMHALHAYRTAPEAAASETVTVRGMAAAAARIADTAQTDRAITVRQARYDRMTWVRVEGPQRVSDLLVTAAEEGECQAERIAR